MSNRTPWEDAFWTPEPIFKGETVFVLASGPSLTQNVCDRIRGRNAIVVNKSFRLAPWAAVWFFTDGHIYESHREDVRTWAGEVVTLSRAAKREQPDKVKRLKGEWTKGFPPIGSPIIRQGRSSGHTAISVAAALGASLIPLLGFDMRLVEGKEHHHAEYAGPRDLDIYAREFVPAFAGWNDDALQAGIRIVNCTPGSAVTEFPFADLDEVLTCAPSRR